MSDGYWHQKGTRPSFASKRPFLHRAQSRMGKRERMTSHQLKAEGKAAHLAEYIRLHESGEHLFEKD